MEGRHVRTIMGALLMILSVVFVGISVILGHASVTSYLELIHVWLFPILIFLSGLALFYRPAFKDIVSEGRRLIRRRKEDR